MSAGIIVNVLLCALALMMYWRTWVLWKEDGETLAMIKEIGDRIEEAQARMQQMKDESDRKLDKALGSYEDALRLMNEAENMVLGVSRDDGK